MLFFKNERKKKNIMKNDNKNKDENEDDIKTKKD